MFMSYEVFATFGISAVSKVIFFLYVFWLSLFQDFGKDVIGSEY